LAEIRPFPGVHYSNSVIKDWAAVICPPYDIISPQQQEELYHASEYNFIRLEYGRELPQDTASDNKYTRAATTLERWLKEGIFEADTIPAVYLHDHSFTLQGKKYKRRNMLVRVRLEEWEKGIVRPHEGTLTAPRGDRLSLLWALQANTSPILAMYQDNRQQITQLLKKQEHNKPIITSREVQGESHTVRAITDNGALFQITMGLKDLPIYIADGHHRYESALAYRQEKENYSKPLSEDDPANFVMMALVDFTDPGLVILAPHRLVRGIAKPALENLPAKLKAFFEIEQLPLNLNNIKKQAEEAFAGPGEGKMVLYGPSTDSFFVLTLREYATTARMMPAFHSEIYKKLDVSIVDHIILENLLELKSEREKASLAYSYDIADAVNRVRNQEFQLAILLSPVKPDVIKAIADAGDKMPRKSTYFYPKAPSGLIINRLAE
jgi:uncharacterized protein (DUF1015 family)